MKDYSLNFEDSKTFVLNYTIKGNQIKINLATGEDYIIPYTKENEVKLLKRMKSQVLHSNEFMNKQHKIFSESLQHVICSGFMIVLNVISLSSGDSVITVLCILGASCSIFNIGYRIYRMVDSKRNIQDVNKNRILLSNEDQLNEKVRGNPNVLANTDERVKEMVSSTPIEQPVFTLNSIDMIKYEQLVQILENIDREEEFGFDYSSVSKEEPFVLNKKLK